MQIFMPPHFLLFTVVYHLSLCCITKMSLSVLLSFLSSHISHPSSVSYIVLFEHVCRLLLFRGPNMPSVITEAAVTFFFSLSALSFQTDRFSYIYKATVNGKGICRKQGPSSVRSNGLFSVVIDSCRCSHC